MHRPRDERRTLRARANEPSAMKLRTMCIPLALAALLILLAPARATALQSPPAGGDKSKAADNQRALLDQAFHSLEDELKAAIEDYQVQLQAASKAGIPREQ